MSHTDDEMIPPVGTVVFRNPGDMDMLSMRIMGLHSKPNTDSPIGQFGTGLKCAIAVLLRNKQVVTIYVGQTPYTFGVIPSTFRDKAFEQVVMYGGTGIIVLPFTTDLARHWELWMAFRELYSNTIDEQGGYATDPQPFDVEWMPNDGFTTIVVQGNEFHEAVMNSEAILDKQLTRCIYGDAKIEVYEGSCEVIYYRGIRAHKLDKPSIFTYNIKEELQLTEDRTIAYSWVIPQIVATAATRIRDRHALEEILSPSSDKFEHQLKFEEYHNPSPEFLAAIDFLAKQDGVYDEKKLYKKPFNQSAKTLMEMKVSGAPEYPRFPIGNELHRRLSAVIADLTPMGMNFLGMRIEFVDVDQANMLSVKPKNFIQVPRDILLETSHEIPYFYLKQFLIKEWIRLHVKGDPIDWLSTAFIKYVCGK